MEKLDLGPNVPKSFGVFPTVAINYNAISLFHWDLNNHPNTLCIVCPLSPFEGEQLVFFELKLIIHAKQGQAIAFRSHYLIHDNFNIIANSNYRYSIVFFIYKNCIKQIWPFGNLNIIWSSDSDDDNNNDNYNQNKKLKIRINNSR